MPFRLYHSHDINQDILNSATVTTSTPSPAPHSISQTATACSALTLAAFQVAANEEQDPGSKLEHSPHPPVPLSYQSNSTNAGVALTCHGTVCGMAFTGLLATMLAF